ncbi:LysR family transcriptional regulator [Paenibacillus sonchi]|uniref:LysR family transcriptional regulator n=1 Tax=Paenibacillus sonchi TaxID=373687 RepID=UPI001E288CDF|nr:LysR family transcriptional regulator [Paenibacillus sonchi]MCE3201060.1 LysR family transcriptional regulator [Paenibacillus sonchi]
MTVETLRVYVTVVEQQSFSRAAEILHLSQPGVSLQIRNLEKEFDVKLMNRSPKWIKLTEAGELLYKRAKEMLNLYESVKLDLARLHDTVSGSLHIGASFTIGEYVLPRLFSSFAKQYPDVEMGITIANSTEIVGAIRDNKIEVGLIEERIEAPDLQVVPFMKDELIIVAAENHPLVRAGVSDITLLQDQIWVLRESGSGTRSFSNRFFEQACLRIKRSYEINSSQGVKEAVFAGLGMAILSRWVVRREIEDGMLKEIPIQGMRLERDFSIVQLSNHVPSRANEVFMERLIKLDSKFV